MQIGVAAHLIPLWLYLIWKFLCTKIGTWSRLGQFKFLIPQPWWFIQGMGSSFLPRDFWNWSWEKDSFSSKIDKLERMKLQVVFVCVLFMNSLHLWKQRLTSLCKKIHRNKNGKRNRDKQISWNLVAFICLGLEVSGAIPTSDFPVLWSPLYKGKDCKWLARDRHTKNHCWDRYFTLDKDEVTGTTFTFLLKQFKRENTWGKKTVFRYWTSDSTEQCDFWER